MLSEHQQVRHAGFREFVRVHIEPYADTWDREQQLPRSVIALLGEAGYLGLTIPRDYGGQGCDAVTFGLLNEAIGRGSSSLTDVVTCQTMVAASLVKWGTPEQKERWLPPLATGAAIAAFALTEPGAGSDTQALITELTPGESDGEFALTGHKKWISCAQFADVFLVFGLLERRAVACLVSSDRPGIRIEPITELLGFRAAGLAELHFENVRVATADIIGKPGFGLSHVGAVGLQWGRISTACSGAGLLRACVEESVTYAARRAIGAQTVGDLGMIRSLIARMGTDSEAARLLCLSACRAEDDRRPEALEITLMAKYFASRAAVRASADAVQIRGASGCHGSSPVARYYRDSKILEIIEGTTQIHEQLLGKMLVDRAPR